MTEDDRSVSSLGVRASGTVKKKNLVPVGEESEKKRWTLRKEKFMSLRSITLFTHSFRREPWIHCAPAPNSRARTRHRARGASTAHLHNCSGFKKGHIFTFQIKHLPVINSEANLLVKKPKLSSPAQFPLLQWQFSAAYRKGHSILYDSFAKECWSSFIFSSLLCTWLPYGKSQKSPQNADTVPRDGSGQPGGTTKCLSRPRTPRAGLTRSLPAARRPGKLTGWRWKPFQTFRWSNSMAS